MTGVDRGLDIGRGITACTDNFKSCCLNLLGKCRIGNHIPALESCFTGMPYACCLKNSVFKRGGFDIAVMSQLCCRFVKCGPETVRHRVKPL